MYMHENNAKAQTYHLSEGESDHCVPVQDYSLRLTGAFKVVGKMIGHSILQYGPGVTGLSPAVTLPLK